MYLCSNIETKIISYMKLKLFILAIAAFMTLQVNANDYQDMKPLRLDTPEMKPELVELPANPFTTSRVSTDYTMNTVSSQGMDFSFFKQKTNPGVKPYKFMDDMTFVGIPLFVAGWIVKSEKNGFKQQTKHSLVTNFKSGVDDYLQFLGPVATVGLKLSGYEGRSDWPRLFASAAMSYGIMAALVNGIKYTAKEMRPDGTSANSWPSGHTATAFVGATMLHKEYGLTRSPWFSVLGYGTATATGVMRVLNNRHWISDVLSGAGIGILSGELAYALSDLMFKNKGLLRGDISGEHSIVDHPSFFSVSMGMGFGTRNMDFDMDDLQGYVSEDGEKDIMNLKFGTSTSVAAEGAYFFNKYIGVGGRLRVNSMPIKGWDKIIDYGWQDLASAYIDVYNVDDEKEAMEFNNMMDQMFNDVDFVIESDHLTEFTADLGVYFNLPVSKRFALGSKLLLGRSIMQEVNLDAKSSGKCIEMDSNGDPTLSKDKEYSTTWDYFTVGGNNTMKFGTGISLTYAHKSNFAWKLFLDYDFARKTYTMTYDPDGYVKDAMPSIYQEIIKQDAKALDPETQSIKKNMNNFVLGGSFVVNF